MRLLSLISDLPVARLLAAGWVLMCAGVSLSGETAPAPERALVTAGRPAASNQIRELLDAAASARRAGDEGGEYALLARVLDLDSTHPNAHARLAAITGLAPVDSSSDGGDPVDQALRHPYDPRALVAASAVLEREGRIDEALEFLERAVWLADVDPRSGLTALRRLKELNESWRRRRIVPVHVHADALIRAREGWRFRMRTLWLSVSSTLDEVLETRFVPVVIGGFQVGESPADLDSIHEAFRTSTREPAEGILAAVTERAIPDGVSVAKKGVAEFLGRSLVVRLPADASKSRVLAHEILHLYGAIHVLDGVDTLMNPTGTSLVLDAPSLRIVRALRVRGFGPGGIEENVLPWIDLAEAVGAYRAALSVNLGMREAGIMEAMGEPGESAGRAAKQVRRATRLDPHLADVARLVAVLTLADGRRTEALLLLKLSSQLYGESSPRGRETAEQARQLSRALEDAAAAAPE